MSKTKFILIVVGLLAVVAAGWYFAQKKLEPPPASIENQLEGWQTYRNEQYGFEIKYPETKFKGYSLSLKERQDKSTPTFELGYWGLPTESFPQLEIRIWDGISIDGRLSYFQNEFARERDFQRVEVLPVKQVLVDGSGAQRFFVVHPDAFEFGSDRLLITLVQHGGAVYEFLLETYLEDTESQNLYDQILSTFKFTEVTLTDPVAKTISGTLKIDEEGRGIDIIITKAATLTLKLSPALRMSLYKESDVIAESNTVSSQEILTKNLTPGTYRVWIQHLKAERVDFSLQVNSVATSQ